MNNKKGISALLETVLLILVVLAAAGIIFGAIIPMLRAPAERAAACSDLMSIASTSATQVTVTANKAGIVSYAVNGFDATGKACPADGKALGGIGSTVSTTLPTTGCGPYIKVSVVPVVTVGGKDVACPAIEAAI